MSKLSKVKQDIIDIVEEEGNTLFCTAEIRRRLNQFRRENGESPLRDFMVKAVLQSMIDDGTVEYVGPDSYILSAPEPEVNDPSSIVNNYNITFNVIVNSMRTRKSK
jgi:hypothetical protein